MSAIELTSSEVPAVPAAAESAWPLAKRIAFACMVGFFLLMNWPFPLGIIPWTGKIGEWLTKPWETLVPLVATRVFHVSADVLPSASGDTTWSYVQVALAAALALVAGLLWAALDKKASRYERVHRLFRFYLRFALGAAMISYGAYKVIQSQFPPPTLDRMVQPLASWSPMGILWTFMGASRWYNLFTGAAELTGGILLTMRRTALLGALISAGAMANVAALNFCYDVPVKLYSTQLLAEALIIAAPDARRLAGIFLTAHDVPLFRRPWAVKTAAVAGTLVVGAYVAMNLQIAQSNRKSYGDLSPRSPLRGIWNVDELTDNGASRPPLTTDLARWRRVVFDSPRFASILLMNDTRLRYTVKLDEKARTLELTDRDNPKSVLHLRYARPDPRTLVFDGVVDGHALHAVGHLSELTAKPLYVTRGFHWINEVPFNR